MDMDTPFAEYVFAMLTGLLFNCNWDNNYLLDTAASAASLYILSAFICDSQGGRRG